MYHRGMRTHSFRDLLVWQKAVALVTSVYRVTADYPVSERYGLVSQMRRAAVSIPCNVSEGHGRSTRGEFLNHISIARGSLNEVRTLLTVSRSLDVGPRDSIAQLEAEADELARMLWSMRRGLEQRAAHSVQRTEA